MRILFVCDEPSLRGVFHALLSRNGHDVEISRTIRSARDKLASGNYDLVLLNLVGDPMAPLKSCCTLRRVRPKQKIAYIHGRWTGFPLDTCPDYLIPVEEDFNTLLATLEKISAGLRSRRRRTRTPCVA